ncbi:PQQ-dependent sugar dehydrogenase [Celeribacter litoreus]|uniref:PQQ-dependent sugar dehydrogenase n=1 Tax=Celeribacter litoreus TaxID=2876714 RepID=UPI001CCF14FF|nr:PQQ-dependent sugar dehydrogenase [Celeribacter litoreus]MCA0043155.1 PQQ-dependent sugar dehydrogenase [Celeribacter litoreus]
MASKLTRNLQRLTLGVGLSASLAGAAMANGETVLDGLDYPWDIEAHEGTIYVTEKAGTLGLFDGESFTRLPVLASAPILNDRGGGLLGLALRPDFAETGRAVLYHHTGTPDARTNRVIEVERDGETWRETRVLFDGIPGHPLYNGGRVAFGPDGMLYVTTGWTENPALPQDLESLAGKILRLTPDGDVPEDNPFAGSPIFSYGHRNPQGITWDETGQMYAAEHGQSGNDEVNRIVAGGNYGWPVIQGNERREGMQTPLAQSGRSTWAPSGLTWHEGRLLLAGLRAGAVLGVSTEGDVTEAYPGDGRIRDVLVVGDEVYAITTNRSPRRDGASDDSLVRLTD